MFKYNPKTNVKQEIIDSSHVLSGWTEMQRKSIGLNKNIRGARGLVKDVL
jgi:hypothetical protein